MPADVAYFNPDIVSSNTITLLGLRFSLSKVCRYGRGSGLPILNASPDIITSIISVAFNAERLLLIASIGPDEQIAILIPAYLNAFNKSIAPSITLILHL